MAPKARPAFANLLRNLGAGVLRVGGSSQDALPFALPRARATACITRADLAAIRATLDAAAAHRAGE